MKKYFVFALATLFVSGFFVFNNAKADIEVPLPASQLKIISALQTSVPVNTASAVITVESQDESGVSTNVSDTTYVALHSDSSTGLFASSPASGPCHDDWGIISVTIASGGTAHKSFCYKDSTVGTHTITVSTDDLASGTQDITFVTPAPADTTAPEITDTFSSNNSNPNYAKVGDRVRVDFESNERAYPQSMVIAGHTIPSYSSQNQDGTRFYIYYDMQSSDTEGPLTYSLTAQDDSGNPITVTGGGVTFDKTAPTLSITSPADNSSTNDNTVSNLNFTASDNLATTLYWSKYVDGNVDGSSNNSMSNGGGVGTSITSQSDGSHTIEIDVSDAAGNIGTAVVHVTVSTGLPDTTAPTIEDTQNDTSYTPDWFTTDFNFILSDIGFGSSGKKSAQYQIDGGGWQDISLTTWPEGHSHAGEVWGYIHITQPGEHTVNVQLTNNNDRTFDASYTVRHAFSITSCQELQNIGSNQSASYYLSNDIDCAGFSFTSISDFSGTLDGQNHKIKNLTITSPNSNWGMFSNTSSGSVIKNIGIENISITGSGYTGGFVGGWNSGLIQNCYVTGNIASNYQQVGGIAGSNNGTIEQCYADIDISGGMYTAGIVGFNTGQIKNSYARGMINGTSNSGGIVGLNESATLINSYSIAKIGDGSVNGGLVGWQYSGGGQSGGYWDVDTSGKQNMCGTDALGGTNCDDTHGLTDVQTKSQVSFIGWDFGEIWAIDPSKNDGYPYLGWQVWPTDLCANMNGIQVSVPDGYHQDGENCTIDEVVQEQTPAPTPVPDPTTGGGSKSGGRHHDISGNGGGEVLGAFTSIYGGSSGGSDWRQKLLAIMMQFLQLLQTYQGAFH